MLKKQFIFLTFLSAFSILPFLSFGQEVLDTIFVTNRAGQKNNIVNWSFKTNINQPAKSIGIQRAEDSAAYFSTIGHATNPAKDKNTFTDNQSASDTNNMYRLFILFQDGSYTFSKVSKVTVLPELPKISSIATGESSKPESQIPTPFQPSIYIYSNPDGNVNISIADVERNNYTIRFFDSTNQFIFGINQINKPLLIIDKANFLHSGWFHYELYKNGKIFEKWKFYVPDKY